MKNGRTDYRVIINEILLKIINGRYKTGILFKTNGVEFDIFSEVGDFDSNQIVFYKCASVPLFYKGKLEFNLILIFKHGQELKRLSNKTMKLIKLLQEHIEKYLNKILKY